MAPKVSLALLFLLGLALRVPGCLLCFTSYEERLRVCQFFLGEDSPKLEGCMEAFVSAFKGLRDIEINYDERGRLHDAFTQMTHALQEEARAKGSFEVAFSNAAKKMLEVTTQLKEVQDCIPPCGLQEVARRFRCRGCYSALCDLPLDCPVQDVPVLRGRQALFSCAVGFQLPGEEIVYSWKFAAQLRTQDMTYFHDLPGGRGVVARIRPVQPEHRGTFCCVIAHDQNPLARLFFYLNVTGPPPRAETELQVLFREVQRWGRRDLETLRTPRPSLGELLASPGALTPGNQLLLGAVAALAAATVTVLGW
ncbi:sperm acrosome membrane-associated protein 6 [Suncus etruscus]|uniref:sperm acrosome membrane-associated protein 6 n=1 Tax=Suncus etruscus TaxID=109475 RepID=UPI00210F4020|nr:sperm acrosome membrane-associated protein 6 [Suncus etruscus]